MIFNESRAVYILSVLPAEQNILIFIVVDYTIFNDI